MTLILRFINARDKNPFLNILTNSFTSHLQFTSHQELKFIEILLMSRETIIWNNYLTGIVPRAPTLIEPTRIVYMAFMFSTIYDSVSIIFRPNKFTVLSLTSSHLLHQTSVYIQQQREEHAANLHVSMQCAQWIVLGLVVAGQLSAVCLHISKSECGTNGSATTELQICSPVINEFIKRLMLYIAYTQCLS